LPWVQACDDAIQDAHPKKILLTPTQKRKRQSLGGKHQSIASKRLGGILQSIEDKARGGQRSGHNRWHVARGIVKPGCKFCETQSTALGAVPGHEDRGDRDFAL
jgi:hypothetical protein